MKRSIYVAGPLLAVTLAILAWPSAPSEAGVTGKTFGQIVVGKLTMMAGGTIALPSPVAGGVAYSGAANLSISAAGTSGQLLQSGGTGTPSFTASPSVTKITLAEGGLVLGVKASPNPTSTDACTAGTFRVSAAGIYVCVASGDVRYAALATPSP